MNLYLDYLNEIKERQEIGLYPKPIENSNLLDIIINNIKDDDSTHRKDSLNFFIYNVLPGTTSAANAKSRFLKTLFFKKEKSKTNFNFDFAFELLSHMKGGPSIKVLLDLAFGNDNEIAQKSADVLKTQVFLYENDTNRLKLYHERNNLIAKDIITSYLNAEFFTKLPEIEEEIDVVTYVASTGDISTDLLSPGSDAYPRSDRELQAKVYLSIIKKTKRIIGFTKQYPENIMLIADKGTMGVGSSRMSGVNNVALWIGKCLGKYIPFVNIAPIVAGSNGISPIFLTTVDVTGGIGIDLKLD